MLMHAFSALLIGLVVLTGAARAEPEVFSKAGYEADRAAAIEGEKLHVLYFTASWCPPCQQMKKTTWVDESVVSWLDEFALVTPIDVDEQSDLSQEFGIAAMPTIVVYRGEEEVGRVIGYHGSVEFKDFLERAESGEFLAQNHAEREAELWHQHVEEQLEAAGDHFSKGDTASARDVYLAIFHEADRKGLSVINPSRHPGIGGFMLKNVADRDEILRDELETFRNKNLEHLKAGNVTWGRLCDWAFLNRAIGDEAGTIAWVERNIEQAANLPLVSPMRLIIEDALKEASRVDLFAEIIDPVLRAGQEANSHRLHVNSRSFQSLPEVLTEASRENFIKEMSRFYAASLIKGERESARTISEMILAIYNTDAARTAMREAAIGVGAEPTKNIAFD